MTDLLEVGAGAGLAVHGARAVPGAADVRGRPVAEGLAEHLTDRAAGTTYLPAAVDDLPWVS